MKKISGFCPLLGLASRPLDPHSMNRQPAANSSDNGRRFEIRFTRSRKGTQLLNLHRSVVPALDSARLPAYLLRLLSEDMVRMAGLSKYARSYESLHLPVMSCLRERNETRCQDHNAIGHVPASQSRQSQDGRREG